MRRQTAQPWPHDAPQRRVAWRLATTTGSMLAALVALILALYPADAGAQTSPALAGTALSGAPASSGGPTPAGAGAGGPIGTAGLELPPVMVAPLSGGMPRPLDDGAASTGSIATAQAELAAGPVVLDRGHIDLLAPQLVDGNLTMTVKDDTRIHDPGIVFRRPADVTVRLGDDARQTIPEGLTALGTPGDPVWILPQTQDPALPWPGWSTEHPSLSGEIDGPVTFRLTNVSGPGRFVMFQTVGFGDARIIASTAAGLPASWTEPVPAHVHASWAFGAPGTYTLTFEASATLTGGASATTDPAAYRFVVEGAAPDPEPEPEPEPGPEPGPDGADSGAGSQIPGGGGQSGTTGPGTTPPGDGNGPGAGSAGDGADADGGAASGGGAAGAGPTGGGTDGDRAAGELASTGFGDLGVLVAGLVALLLLGITLAGQPARRPQPAHEPRRR